MENEASGSKKSNRNQFKIDNENLSLESVGTQGLVSRTDSETYIASEAASKNQLKKGSTKLKIKHLADEALMRHLERNYNIKQIFSAFKQQFIAQEKIKNELTDRSQYQKVYDQELIST